MLLGARQFFERRGAPTPPLPYDAEVEYLESVGGQYIDTGVSVCNAVIGTEIKFQATEIANDRWLFGMYNNSMGNGYNYLIGSYNGNSWDVFLYNTQYRPYIAVNTNTTHVVKINIDGKTQFDDIVLLSGSTSASYDGPYNTTNAWIFATHRQGDGGPFGYYLKSKVFYCKMYKDGVLVRNFIPVRFTNEQGVSEGAMYDRVSGALFRNAGTGAFVIGLDK